ncbi:uncharacterized protein LOC134831785 [Culicoides brevitarsis]|uniref:uncharacterized protein LOC134831785 n=1 Tax=Culicoides brevitarsis TaxID=469753 RepID=UPI00307BE4E1
MTWVQGSPGLKMPESAVVLGKGEAHTSIYIGSVLHEGKRVLAQVHPSKKAAYFHRYGQDIEMLYYKILCVPNSNWAKFNQSIPENALMVNLGTENVYIGRCIVTPNRIYIGTIHPTDGMSVDFYGESAKLDDCEILVSGDVIQEPTAEVKTVTNTKISEEKAPEVQILEEKSTEVQAPEVKSPEVQEKIEEIEETKPEISSNNENEATVESTISEEIQNDNELREYEALETQMTLIHDDERPPSLELIEENDEFNQNNE